MKLETFFEKFDQFADAPGAVAKVRELVLQWAVQGRLVRQDSNEEPASRLIRDAVHARRKLVAVKVVRDETLDLGFLDQAENGLPDGWVHAPLSVYVGVIMGQSPPSSAYNESGEGLPFYQGKAQFGRLYPTATDWCTEPTKIGEPGDVVISVRAPVGPTNMLREKSCIGRGLTSLRSLGGDQMHLLYTLRAFERSIAAMGVGSTFVAISKRDLDDFRIPIPPLAEQKRIVAKVEELMALCDRLEAQQQEREMRHAALARASLARFADAPAPVNLPFLFHKSYDISPADLRKSILTLAVQGKLVPQDPNDEPAESALRRCGVDLKRWAVAEEQERQDTPSSWTWIGFAGVGEQRLGKMLDAQKNRGELKPYLRNTNVQWMRFELDDVKEMRVEEREEAELRLKPGDLLICEGGEPGRCAIWRDEVPEMYFQKALHRVRPCDEILSEFLALNLQIDCRNEVLSGYFTGATIKHLTGRSLSEYPIPIPPLAEQRRIVAKVEQLMALVDELETQLATARATGSNLMEAVVAELTAKA